MCGVIGLVHDRDRDDLGLIASELLETLQYRGYDSTGAVIQGGPAESVVLRKGVGAPSVLVHELGITKLAGRVFCGQVRWATFGVVDEANAQPHVVRCKTFLYGAHNGNVTNCDELKIWLQEQGHTVASDNDGEMVVHMVEHFFAIELGNGAARDVALRRAVVEASKRLEGSFAAVVVDPETHRLIAIKRGSSLYFGVGQDQQGHFGIASSDLSAVLKRTHVLVGMSEGEMVEYQATEEGLVFQVRALDEGEGTPREAKPQRSRLRVEDTGLQAPFQTFMDQEIHAQPATAEAALRMFRGGSKAAQHVRVAMKGWEGGMAQALDASLSVLRGAFDEPAIKKGLMDLAELPAARALEALELVHPFTSDEAVFFQELLAVAPEKRNLVCGLDAYVEALEVAELEIGVSGAVQSMVDTIAAGRRIYVVCCGTSYHAAKAASAFFAELAGADVLPMLPGEFRSQCAHTVGDGDLLIAVSQSGETKDLIDVINQVRAGGHRVGLVALVNNLNSTLAQEKAETVIPLRCGAEIAVPATKSFINQLTVFYGLARALGEARGRAIPSLPDLPGLIRRTLDSVGEGIEEAAEQLYLAPSIHLLATRMLAVAKEGALKVREVVLNHTEGFEGSEFKHGPNTILGFNTLFGPAQLQQLLDDLSQDIADGKGDAEALVRGALRTHMPSLYADYPLVFITGPARRDVDLTISQINTHKIRGAISVVIAEDDPRLRLAAEKAPADHGDYKSVYVPLPPTGNGLMTAFSASVALQLLALRMSEKKKAYLEELGLRDHGVHPDSPKNVSKSITVD